jgi:hypothetical protein
MLLKINKFVKLVNLVGFTIEKYFKSPFVKKLTTTICVCLQMVPDEFHAPSNARIFRETSARPSEPSKRILSPGREDCFGHEIFSGVLLLLHVP